MAPKRTTRTAARTPSAQQQSKLSFQSKVTKPSAQQQSKTVRKKDAALVEDIARADIKDEHHESESEGKVATPVEESAAPDPLHSGATTVKTEDVLGGRAQESDVGAIGGGKGSGWVSDEEERARKISDTQIKRYWRAKEQERKAPRVHQQGLTVYEKVLREWDVSGQYGPCIGIARLKRWKRANLLGLHPPIEVLAVLLKEMDAGEAKVQRAYVDELMNSRFGTET